MILASFFSSVVQFESYLVENPEERFSRDKTQILITHAPVHDKTNEMTYAPSKDTDQPRHLPSLIRVPAVCM